MTNTQAQQVLGTMLMRYDLTDAELEAIGMAGEALEDDWIPVEKGLPEPNEEVLISWETSAGKRLMMLAQYEHPDIMLREIPVTHWKHLPKPPEEVD